MTRQLDAADRRAASRAPYSLRSSPAGRGAGGSPLVAASAVFLSSARGLETTHASFGYAAFAATMTVGRLTGDRVVRRLGGSAIIAAGAGCAVAGFSLATLLRYWQSTLIGFALIGAGCSNVVPVLFRWSGARP
jgi:hypothetical protein